MSKRSQQATVTHCATTARRATTRWGRTATIVLSVMAGVCSAGDRPRPIRTLFGRCGERLSCPPGSQCEDPPCSIDGGGRVARMGDGIWRKTYAPKRVWDVDLGAVIFARPLLVSQVGPDAETTTFAYVGTHSGRFVGVDVGSGALASEVWLGGMVWSAAVSSGHQVYVGADDDHLYSLDMERGTVDWALRLGDCDPPRARGPEGVRCDVDGGPTLGPGGDLYVGADGMYRVGIDGVVRWHYGGAADVRPSRHVFSTPLVLPAGPHLPGGAVVFGGQDGFVTALDLEGTLIWRYEVVADVDGSPVLGHDGATIIVGADGGRIVALDLAGGVRWTFHTAADVRNAVAVDGDGHVIVGSQDGNLYRLDRGGRMQWALPTWGPIVASPVIYNRGTIVVGSASNRLYGVSPLGVVAWNIDVGADIDATVAITDDGTIVFGCDDGHLRALR